jgi:hypothetical protein
MNQIPNLSDSDYATLTNALRTAADKFAENAQHLRERIPLYEHAENIGKVPIISANGARQLADQFELQTRQTLDLLDRIEEVVDGD